MATIKLADLALVITAVIGVLTILKMLGQGIIWALRSFRHFRAGKNPPEFPVQLTWEERSEYHPGAGFHEIMKFEVFNRTDHPVTVKGFGLDLTFEAQAEWHSYEQARDSPPVDFPAVLAPFEGLQGYIDAELLSDQVYSDGEDKYWRDTEAYVEVVGFGVFKLKKSSPPAQAQIQRSG